MHCSRTKSQQVQLKKKKKNTAETHETLNVNAEAEYKHTLSRNKKRVTQFEGLFIHLTPLLMVRY